jgi:signal transduction histidine kinase
MSHSSALQPLPAGGQHVARQGVVRGAALQLALRLVMALTDLPVATFTFVLMVTMVSASIGLIAAFLVGLPLLILTGMIARVLAKFERARMRLFLDIEIPRLPGRPKGFKAALTDGPTWRAIVYPLLQFPLAIATFTSSVAALGTSLAMISMPAWINHVPSRHADLWLFSVGNDRKAWLATAAGVALLVFGAGLTYVLTTAEGALAKTLLGVSAAQLARRVDALEGSRARVVDAAEAERRRIERDLHDGAQQRLVSLAMNLGRARARYDDDPDAARVLLDEAHADAKHALVELRDLARGLHPAVLTDRGLDAALSGLAGRSPVPVTLDVQVEPRCNPTIEAIAYFVVSEALANIAKHSGAARADIVARRAGDRLQLTIRDDGVGGASAHPGSGLAGLTDRVGGVDGSLRIDSPVGGPTILTVELPCES